MKPVVKKLQNRFNVTEIYYTFSNWETKKIDGVDFIYVIKNIGIREIPKLMRKDSLIVIK